MANASTGDINVSQEKISNVQPIAFASGEIVPVSGVWRSTHERCQNVPELWFRKDDHFPPCPKCGRAASFLLVEEVQHISEDADFA
jgi:hypothetical protein